MIAAIWNPDWLPHLVGLILAMLGLIRSVLNHCTAREMKKGLQELNQLRSLHDQEQTLNTEGVSDVQQSATEDDSSTDCRADVGEIDPSTIQAL